MCATDNRYVPVDILKIQDTDSGCSTLNIFFPSTFVICAKEQQQLYLGPGIEDKAYVCYDIAVAIYNVCVLYVFVCVSIRKEACEHMYAFVYVLYSLFTQYACYAHHSINYI